MAIALGTSAKKLRLGSATPSRLYAGSTAFWDSDAAAYAAAVEAADGQSLELGVVAAYHNFILGCKADGIFSAIKAACVLCGARTLSGALVPLVGTAPTNVANNFASGDYDRSSGLAGDGATKYLDSGRNSNADPQDDYHAATWVSSADNGASGAIYLGAGGPGIAGSTNIGSTTDLPSSDTIFRSRSSSSDIIALSASSTGLLALSRNESGSYSYYSGSLSASKTRASETPVDANYFVYSRNVSGSPSLITNARLAFYSIGESLDLAAFDARVTALVTAIGAAV